MGRYQLREVVTAADIRRFLEMPLAIYSRQDPWIRPLDAEIGNIFNPEVNKKFEHGEAIRWLLTDERDRTLGRVAAFYDRSLAGGEAIPTGGLGFFECVNDQQAANQLFDAAVLWLKEKGMQAVDGPVNFGTRDHFWGCLKEGTSEPIFNMPYNPSYYNQLFQNYGFRDYFDQFTYHLEMKPENLNPLIRYKAERLKRDPRFVFSTYDPRKGTRIALEFKDVFNSAWSHFTGIDSITDEMALLLFKKLKPILDPRLIIMAYADGKPIGFFIMIPDLNQIIGDFNGKLGLVNKIRLFYRLKIRKQCTRVIGLIFGVIPEYQSKGIEAGLVMRFAENVLTKGFPYTDLEMNWIGDFNPTMRKLVELIGGKVLKVHTTYRYLFDRKATFQRAPVVNNAK